ncbi:hypothetical protein BDF22DRAFT_744135 [Syncephalis plumigaleata]|nr:hypothetical protein BDF22DRAFT_744135 [Syncephalis plumigaleata]
MQSLWRTLRGQPQSQPADNIPVNSNSATSNRPVDLEGGQHGQAPSTPAIGQPAIASDPLTYGQGLYFGPQFIGTADTAEELGNTAWRRVGGGGGHSHINNSNSHNDYASLSFNDETESSRSRSNTSSNSKKIKNDDTTNNNTTNLPTTTTSDNSAKSTPDLDCQYRLTFQLDALQPGKLTVAWLAQPYPTEDTSGVLAIRTCTAPLKIPPTHRMSFAEGVDPDILVLPSLNSTHRSSSTNNNNNSNTEDNNEMAPDHLNNDNAIDIPLIILIESESGAQSLLTLASLTSSLTDEGINPMTILLQKFRTKGQTYILERVYGVDDDDDHDNGNDPTSKSTTSNDHTTDESGICVVCIADPSTVAVLPCRHLCLCAECAEELRNRSCFCPICRQAFHTMIRIGDVSA